MRAMRTLTASLVSAREPDRSWLPGLPHVLMAAAIWPVLGGSACLVGLMLASLVSFVVYLPLTALALNRGEPLTQDKQAPELTPLAHAVLLVLWTATAWAGALMVTVSQ
jgi:hypothetical protein